MYYNSIYSQLFNFIPWYRFEKIVKKSGGDRYCKHFTAWKQFLTLLFAQISGKDSLREIETALLANHKRLYHLGMEAVAKSTLSEAMNRRNPEIFKALFEEILDRVMAVAPKHKFKFKNPLYAIDSTTIDLCFIPLWLGILPQAQRCYQAAYGTWFIRKFALFSPDE